MDTIKFSIFFCVLFAVANLGSSAQPKIMGLWQDLPLSCYQCKGEEECKKPISELKSVKCSTDNNAECMIVFKSETGVVQRGCSTRLESSYEKHCKANPDKCYKCRSNNCNIVTMTKDLIECIDCSSESNSDCLNNANSTKLGKRLCHKSCMTVLYLEKDIKNPTYNTLRTCLDDKEPEDQDKCRNNQDEFCRSCDEKNCNEVILPQDRLECNQCSTEKECKKPVAKYCQYYQKDDQCLFIYPDKTSVQLGCRSSYSEQALLQFINNDKAVLCNGPNCNELKNNPQTQVCKKCDSATNADCARNPAAITETVECRDVPDTNCYVAVKDGRTIRGCLRDLEDSRRVNCLLNNDKQCQFCYGSNCNEKVFPENRRSCYHCSSNDDKECADKPNESTKHICSKYVENDACVVRNLNGTIQRGCASEFICDGKDTAKCRICLDDDCNSIKLNHSGKLSSSLNSIALSILTVLLAGLFRN